MSSPYSGGIPFNDFKYIVRFTYYIAEIIRMYNVCAI